MKHKHKDKKAFTIVELIIVAAIISILTAISAVSYGAIRKYAIQAAISSDLSSISKLITLSTGGTTYGYPESLDLVNNGAGINVDEGTDYFYYADNSTETPVYCLAVMKDNISYKIDQENTITIGDCYDKDLVLSVDAGNTDSYPGSGTTWTDTSGNNNNCNLGNGAVFATEGGGSISFDGVNDYVSCTTFTPIDTYSIEAWFNTDILSSSGNADQTYFGNTIVATSTNYATWISVKLNEISGRSFSSSTTGKTTVGADIVPSKWFHVVVTSSKGGSTKTYINGVLRGTYNADTTSWAGSFTIGDLRPNRNIGFNGYIAKVSVLNRIETETEINYKYFNEKSRYGL